jgi:hypothetical protein
VGRIGVGRVEIAVLHVPHPSGHVDLRVYAALPAAPVFPVEAYLPVRVPSPVSYLTSQVDNCACPRCMPSLAGPRRVCHSASC